MGLPSVDGVNQSFSNRLRFNKEILNNAYWRLPVDPLAPAEYMPVGRGPVTCSLCGTWTSFQVCSHTDLHKGEIYCGVDFTGKLVVVNQHLFCNKSSCPICFLRGWSQRTARSLANRLKVGVERGFGDVEHITVSVSDKDKNLPEIVFREKCRVALLIRGVLGGCMIFHGYRIDRNRQLLVWSPHYHTMGFISGGFNVCRECVHERGDCYSCHSFKGREAREYAKDGYLVKVLAKRKNVVGTIFYQLHHSTLKVSMRRFHIVTWFGLMGNRKLSSGRKPKAAFPCPVCGSEMEKKHYMGDSVIPRNLGDPEYKKVNPVEPLDSSGSPSFDDEGGDMHE